ncbi:copper resistance protein B [Croceicoccus sp. YJ47]|uniref:copper resistance protein B n=1 Tax=Croceicoccus sp. YJ47 TaxID=2798724 RepID=UPI001924C6CF|nr:copper resistance protein B [Croceicoccus sp. YJ47]QQN74930.1 copper resistance protein B [Croceicoccus sp. YJ47]
MLAVPAMGQTVTTELDLFEVQEGKGDDPFLFDSAITVAGDEFAGVLMTEGGHDSIHFNVHAVTSQALFAYMPNGSTTLMAGARHDFRPGRDLSYASFAVTHTFNAILAGEHFLFISQDGDVTGAGEVLASVSVNAALTLEPRVGLGWAAQDIAREDTAGGFSDVQVAVRLRQSVGPVFNVYVGGVHERLLGRSRDIAQTAGDRPDATRFLVGGGFFF